MTYLEHQPPDDLRQRIRDLEVALSRLQATAPSRGIHRLPLVLNYGLVPMLVITGWAMAQQAPLPEQQTPTPQAMLPDPDANDLIRNVGGITQVSAPFEVVDAEGRVILTVGTDDKDASVSISVEYGAGALRLNSDEGETATQIGADENGNGTVRVHDAAGNLRASVSGTADVSVFDPSGDKRFAALETTEHGGVIRALNVNGQTAAGVGVDPKGKGLVAVVDTGGQAQLTITETGSPAISLVDGSSKQLAVVDAVNGKGRVAILEQGRTGAELTTAPAGGGRLVVHNSSGQAIAAVGPWENGKGSLSVLEAGEVVAILAADESGNGGMSVSNAQGTGGVQAYGYDPEMGGGSIAAMNESNDRVALVAASEEGKGIIAVVGNDHLVAALGTDPNGNGRMVLANAEGQKGVSASGQGEGESSGGSVLVFNQAEEEAITLRVEDQGGGVIGVYAGDDAAAELSGDELALYESAEPILSLESDPGQLVVFDQDGEAVVIGLDDQGAGQVIVSRQGGPLAKLGATPGAGGQVAVYGGDSDKVLAAMTGRRGAGLVAVTNSNGQVVSEMSVFNEQGQVVVWNPGGQVPAAIMARSGSGGLLQVFNDTVNVGNLFVGPNGGGQLQLHDPSGVNMIEAGSGVNGVGIVRAGPNAKCAGVMMGLANPDCLQGRLNK